MPVLHPVSLEERVFRAREKLIKTRKTYKRSTLANAAGVTIQQCYQAVARLNQKGIWFPEFQKACPESLGVTKSRRQRFPTVLSDNTKYILQGSEQMLVLSRHKDEHIIIDDRIRVTVVEIRGDKVRLGIEATRDTIVHREEVWSHIHGRPFSEEDIK